LVKHQRGHERREVRKDQEHEIIVHRRAALRESPKRVRTIFQACQMSGIRGSPQLHND